MRYSAEEIKRARKTAKKTKRSIRSYLPGALVPEMCDCNRCWDYRLLQAKRTIRDHRNKYGIHPKARTPVPLAGTNSHLPESAQMEVDSGFAPWSPSSGPSSRAESPTAWDQPALPLMFNDGGLSESGFFPDARSCSRSHLPSDSNSNSNSSTSSSSRSLSCLPRPLSRAASLSDKEVCLISGNPWADIDFFGQNLANLSISGASKRYSHPSFNDDQGNGDWDDDDDEDEDDDDSGDNDVNGDDDGGGEPDNPDDPDAGQVDDPKIQVPPEGPGDGAGDPGGDNEGVGIPALEEDPTLLNIYLRTWVLYAFHGATQAIIQAVLESHQSALLAHADLHDPDFIAEVQNMPTTLRSLERRIGMDFSELVTIYPVCPKCGKRYTMEEVNALQGPQCIRHVAVDQCPGVLYTENTLADGTQKRTPVKSFPYNSLPAALGRLLSRVGIADLAQHWRRNNNPDDEPLEDPPEPLDPQHWFDRMGPNTRFGDISRAWGWHAQATGMRRGFSQGEYGDEPIGDAPLSLAHLPLGLNLGLNLDGFQAFKGKFAAGSSYSANGVYLIINNLPFHQRNLIENMVLAMVLPGPHEPKGYAFEQMLEPLIDDLIQLARGMMLPVYNPETSEIEERLVYANISALIVDWIARIKCTGHVGIAAEENHCPYCEIQQCLLATVHGYQSVEYDFRDPNQQLQDKHRGLRAPEHRRAAIRLETGTSFTEFDRIPGFFASENSPIDAMHLLDLGIIATLVRNIIFKHGMLRKQFRQQADEDSPQARFDAFLARTIFPHHCSRISTRVDKMDSRTKAEQWRLLRLVMPAAYFEAWRVNDAIPIGDIPRGGRNTKEFKAQMRSARLLLQRRRRVHVMDELDPNDAPRLEDCASSRDPRVSLAEIAQGGDFMEQVGVEFAEMNVHLTPSFHAITHLPDHIRKYGSIYNTLTARFERANRILGNVNTNGHGRGVLEATMAKGFLHRTECHCYVNKLQSIEDPSPDDITTTEVLLRAMRNGPEHEVQRGMLEAILAGEAPMHGQEEIRLASTSAQVNFQDRKHRGYYNHVLFKMWFSTEMDYLRTRVSFKYIFHLNTPPVAIPIFVDLGSAMDPQAISAASDRDTPTSLTDNQWRYKGYTKQQ